MAVNKLLLAGLTAAAASIALIEMPAHEKTAQVLQEQGMTDIRTSYGGILARPFNETSCPVGSNTVKATNFTATNREGVRVEGIVCYETLFMNEAMMSSRPVPQNYRATVKFNVG